MNFYGLQEIRSVHSLQAGNDLLKEGWLLLAITPAKQSLSSYAYHFGKFDPRVLTPTVAVWSEMGAEFHSVHRDNSISHLFS